MKKSIIAAIAIGFFSLVSSSAFAIDVNTATADQLDASKLTRVGKMTAQKIVDERTKNGPFKDGTDMINRVPGLGAKFLQSNAQELQFGAAPATPVAGTAAPAATPAAAPAAAPAATPAPAPAAAPAAQ